MNNIQIQLPQDPEAKRCVLICIENHIGVILPLVTKNGLEYAPVVPYENKELMVVLRKIKLEALTTTDGAKGLSHIVRLCIDAGVHERLPELQSTLTPAQKEGRL